MGRKLAGKDSAEILTKLDQLPAKLASLKKTHLIFNPVFFWKFFVFFVLKIFFFTFFVVENIFFIGTETRGKSILRTLLKY